MKILHLCSQDNGGAGRAALRLHKALLQSGVDSKMLVQNKTSDLPTVERLAKTRVQKFFTISRIAIQQIPTLLYPKRKKDIFSCNIPLSNRALIRRIQEIDPDIIHLHWINEGFLNIKDLVQFKKPIIWSLHDANPYTGGCHIVEHNCVGVTTHCQKCPQLQSKFKYDLSYWTFRAKAKTYPKLNLTINGLSTWITQCARESALFKGLPIINLPNLIDTSIYKPFDKNLARSLLGISNKKTTIVFGALSGTQIPRKGYAQLKEALELLPNKNQYELVVFGSSEGEEIAGIKSHFLGHIYDDVTLRIIYSSATMTLVPSLSESFGQVALESLACGTPVVCFNSTGLKDIVKHKKNGYLATPFQPQDLAKGIQWITNLACDQYSTLSQSAIKDSQYFSHKSITPQYIEQYSKILKNLLMGGGDKKFIGFGALSGTQIPRKGYTQLKEALELLPDKNQYELVVFGSSEGEEIAGIKTHFLGHIYDDVTLALIYNAIDVFVTPSLAENLSNAIMESLSCGTPVVAFDIGGNSDMIKHKNNGYLAKDSRDLGDGILWVLHQTDYAKLSHNARLSVIENFDYNSVQRYISFYKDKLNASSTQTLD